MHVFAPNNIIGVSVRSCVGPRFNTVFRGFWNESGLNTLIFLEHLRQIKRKKSYIFFSNINLKNKDIWYEYIFFMNYRNKQIYWNDHIFFKSSSLVYEWEGKEKYLHWLTLLLAIAADGRELTLEEEWRLGMWQKWKGEKSKKVHWMLLAS